MRKAAYMVLGIIIMGNADWLRAEVVNFKNGDQINGEWLRVIEGKLTFKSETLGELTIPVASIRTFTTAKPAVVMLRGGSTFRGKLALGSSGDWYVDGEKESRVIPPTAVEAIYLQEIYEPNSPERKGKAWQNWHGTTALGYSRERGDIQSGSASAGVDAIRLQPDLPGLLARWRSNYHLALLFANTKPFNGPRISANSVTSSLRQDYLFTASNFVFVLAQHDHIQAQSLDLRQTYGAGLGRDLLHTPRTTLNLLGGTTYVNEDFQTEARHSIEGLIGEKLSLKISEHLGFSEYLNFYPSMSDAGQYRFDMTSTLSARVMSWLSMNTGFTDRYLSHPLIGHRNNDFLVTTGLGIRF